MPITVLGEPGGAVNSPSISNHDTRSTHTHSHNHSDRLVSPPPGFEKKSVLDATVTFDIDLRKTASSASACVNRADSAAVSVSRTSAMSVGVTSSSHQLTSLSATTDNDSRRNRDPSKNISFEEHTHVFFGANGVFGIQPQTGM